MWIIGKTDGLGPPVAGMKQRLIRRVDFPKKRVENPVRSKLRKFTAQFVTLAIIPDRDSRSRFHGFFTQKITVGNIPIQINTSPHSSPSATLYVCRICFHVIFDISRLISQVSVRTVKTNQ